VGAAGSENELGEKIVLWSIFKFQSLATALLSIRKYKNITHDFKFCLPQAV
jgi:hypothetical protein